MRPLSTPVRVLFLSFIVFHSDARAQCAFQEDARFARDVVIEGEWAFASDASHAGAVDVYRRQGGTWSIVQQLVATPPAGSEHRFGSFLEVQGTRLIVGSRGLFGATALAHEFELDVSNPTNPQWTPRSQFDVPGVAPGDLFTSEMALDGDRLLISAPSSDVGNENEGTAYFFRRDPSTGSWLLEQTIQAPLPQPWGWFGASVDLAGDFAAIGAARATTPAGAIFTYERDAAGVWNLMQEIQPPIIWGGANFGAELATDGVTLVASSYDLDFPATHQGAVWSFGRDPGTGLWEPEQMIQQPLDFGQNLGYSLDLDGNRLAILAPSRLVAAAERGVVVLEREPASGRWVERSRTPLEIGVVEHAYGSVHLSGDDMILAYNPFVSTPLVRFFDLSTCDPLGQRYCAPALPNSTGRPAAISAMGSTIVGGNPLELVAQGLPESQFGYFLASMTQGVFTPPGSQGVLCIGVPAARFASQLQNSSLSGSMRIDVDTLAIPMTPPVPIQTGETWHFQCWYRDLNPSSTSNFTDAVSIAF